jgi:hypothetical protein
MPMTTHLKISEKFEIQTYKQPKDIATLLRTHVAFSGSLNSARTKTRIFR